MKGGVVVKESRYSTSILKVERLTKTQVVLSDGSKYRRKNGREVGTDLNIRGRIHVPTEQEIFDLKLRALKAKNYKYVTTFDFKKLSLPQLKEVAEILKRMENSDGT